MSLSAFLPFLMILFSPSASSGWQAQFQQCAHEQNTAVRLACYDALARYQTAEHVQATEHVQKEQPSVPPVSSDIPVAVSEFVLHKNPDNGDLSLTRIISPHASLIIACNHNITDVQIKLIHPWQGNSVSASDGDTSDGWFIRNNGKLLEHSRGLPAIQALKYWMTQPEITLSDTQQTLRIPLTGLADAIPPLRQQCRW